MAAKSDGGRSPQSAAAPKTEGSLWETVLGACGLRPEAQHPRLDGNGACGSLAGIALPGDGGGDHFASAAQAQDRADEEIHRDRFVGQLHFRHTRLAGVEALRSFHLG